MPYRPPGAYARFVKTAGAVNSAGNARVMAIVGTGTLMYDAYNVAVEREADRATVIAPYDALPNDTVFEVTSITSKQKYNGTLPADALTWVSGTHFNVKDSKYIVWYTDPTQPATVTQTVGSGGAAVGNVDFASLATAAINVNKKHLIQNGSWRLEVTYVDPATPANGAYRVINDVTKEVIGEFVVGSSAVSTAIPGINLTVTSTFRAGSGGVVSTIAVGDYTMFTTVAALVPTEYVAVDAQSVPIENTRIKLPVVGDTYYVSYTYKKPTTAFQPKVFYDYDDVVREYGNYDVTASGNVLNSLSLGAEIAFLNGAVPVVCVQAMADSDFEIKAALQKLRKDVDGIGNVSTIVPLTTSKTVGAEASIHVVDMSNIINGKERMVYLAAAPGETSTQSITAAKSYTNERVVYVAPAGAYKDIRNIITGRVSERLVNASYLAVGVAAVGLKNDPAEPLTNKFVAGFNRVSTSFEESEMNNMAAAGVLILKQVGSNIKIRHGITTSTSDVNSVEITLIQIKDYVIQSTRQVLADLYIGNKLRPTVVSDVQSSLLSILNQFKSQEVLIGYSNVSVKRSKDDPRQIDVRFEIEAIYPLNYIAIEFGFSSN